IGPKGQAAPSGTGGDFQYIQRGWTELLDPAETLLFVHDADEVPKIIVDRARNLSNHSLDAGTLGRRRGDLPAQPFENRQ
ncbi:MAG: hypothetical protein ACRELF_29995, partial [Gemmataceae bacterium]